jgi:Ser/Thr protein kinase RdoA (MazF antagonist)
LSGQSVAEHLRRHYGLNGRIERVAKGRADNFHVEYDGACWLFKVFQPEYTLSRIERAADFVSFVVDSSYPARQFVRSVEGTPVLSFEHRASVLIPWIDGRTPGPNTVSSCHALGQIGRLCGRLRRLGEDYPSGHALDYSGSSRSLGEKRAALLRLMSVDGEVVAEAQTRLEILDALGEELERSHARARRGIIHGDFSASHVVFQSDDAVGVIDMLGELYLPGWEMMRAFFQSVPSSLDGIEAWWRAFIAGYAIERPISREEIEIAYDTYVLQLTSSTYGLRPPLDDRLREFGRWRTATAQQLAARRGELRALMASWRC